MSGAPIISGTNQLPKPPIIAGMTVKKIMIRPCAVTSVFQAWPVSIRWLPGDANWARMISDRMPPTVPATIAKMR